MMTGELAEWLSEIKGRGKRMVSHRRDFCHSAVEECEGREWMNRSCCDLETNLQHDVKHKTALSALSWVNRLTKPS